MNIKIWIIGSGPMAVDYVKVLNDLDVEFKVIGRGKDSAESFAEQTGIQPYVGGLVSFLENKLEKCTHAIVSVGVEELTNTTIQLLEYGIKNILVEKPAGLNSKEIVQLADETKKRGANICVAYNRRFYASTLKAKNIIANDGGVTSFHFEFTEWSHKIVDLKKAPGVKENWILGNSSHVIDLAFFLGGRPIKISTYYAGSLNWHPSGSVFTGAGISENEALFSYHANWDSAGRWRLEFLTKNYRLHFHPIEKLRIQKIGELEIYDYELINYDKDLNYKPGLFKQVEKFLNEELENFCTIKEQAKNIIDYSKIAGYN